MNFEKLDKYYTKKSVALKCLSEINFEDYDYIVEPSAGNGSFFNQIKHNNKIGIDIKPENKNIKKIDWFNFKINETYKKVLIIGNPPFGKNNNLSRKFLQHSFKFNNVKTIAFILPNVYNKHTKQKIIPKNWYINKIIPLEKKSFLLNNVEKDMPCSFFIFTKNKKHNLKINPNKYNYIKDFKFTNKNNFDIFLFGAAPKKLTKNPKKNNRGYYIKSLINTELLIKRLKKINWKGNSCANGGVYWLTKYEILEHYFLKYMH